MVGLAVAGDGGADEAHDGRLVVQPDLLEAGPQRLDRPCPAGWLPKVFLHLGSVGVDCRITALSSTACQSSCEHGCGCKGLLLGDTGSRKDWKDHVFAVRDETGQGRKLHGFVRIEFQDGTRRIIPLACEATCRT